MNVLTLDPATAVGLIASTVIPLLAALLSRAHWPQEITGLLTLALSTGDGFLAEWAHAGNGFDWKPAVTAAGVSYVLAVLSHYGLWKDTVTASAALNVGSKPAANAYLAQHAGAGTDPAQLDVEPVDVEPVSEVSQ